MLWVCEILLGGNQNSLSGILLLEEKRHVKSQSSGNIRWFREKLEQHPQIAVLQVSDLFSNKGTTKYFRMYAEIEEKKGGR